MNTKRRAAILALFGAAVIAVAPAALARRRAGFRMRGLPSGARHKGPVLTREQLRQCVDEQDSINAAGVEADRLQSSLQNSEVPIKNLEAEINVREQLVDRYSQQSVDDFNTLVDRHKRMVAAYNEKLPAANAQAAKVNASVQRFNTKCADRVYYESDMRAVTAGK